MNGWLAFEIAGGCCSPHAALTIEVYHLPMRKLTHDQLKAALDELEAALPRMIAEYPESDLMDAFAGEAEMIEYKVDDEDRAFFSARVQCMLRDAGLIPGDDEPCDIQDEP